MDGLVRFSPVIFHTFNSDPIDRYTVGLLLESRNLLANVSRWRVQIKTSEMRSSRPAYLRADNGLQGQQEKVLVQTENRETRKATTTKVYANVFPQANRLHRVHGDHRG
jgi:hypothetical protein